MANTEPQEIRFNSEHKEEIDALLQSDKHATEEEFQNFMVRVSEVEKIIKQLSSTDFDEQQQGMRLADELLAHKDIEEIPNDEELLVKVNRTVINKCSPEDSDPSQMSQEAFKRSVEKDAKARAEDRQARNERADTYKRIGNGAFRSSDYVKAVTYFGKALEQRKDSAVLWNNRALGYIALGLYEKALYDCEWALKINENNIKALLNSAKCHKLLGHEDKYKEFLELARERNPTLLEYIAEFQKKLEDRQSTDMAREASSEVD